MKKLVVLSTVAIAALALTITACGGGDEATPTPPSSPAGPGTAGPTGAPTTTATEPPGPAQTFEPGEVDPVSFNDLIEFLPAPPAGWEAGEPSGGTFQMQGFSWSQATGDYTSVSTDEYVDVVIFDSAYYTGFAWWAAWEYGFEWGSTDGYARSITFRGYPAWKMYDKPDSYTLSVGVADRFLVIISAETESSLDLFAGGIAFGGIAALG